MSNTGFSNADLTVDYLLHGSPAGAFPIHVGTDPGDYINTETFTVGFSQNELTITFLVNHSYSGNSGTDGLIITDATNNLAALQSFTQGPNNPAGYTVNLSADSIDVHWQGASFQAGDTITLDFGFAQATPPVAADAAFSTGEDTVLTAAVTASGDPPVRYSLDANDNQGLDFHSDGTFRFDPTGSYEYLGAHETATVSFDYYAIGGDGARWIRIPSRSRSTGRTTPRSSPRPRSRSPRAWRTASGYPPSSPG